MNSTGVFLDTGLSSVLGGANQSRVGREEIGAQLLAACVEQMAGWNVRFLRPDSIHPNEIADAVRAGPCDALVLFPYTYTKWLADKVAQRFKGEVPIIYGGYHVGVGLSARQVMNEGVADYVVAGRGETALPELLKSLETGAAKPRVLRGGISRALLDQAYPLDRFPWPIRRPELMQDLAREPLPFMPPRCLVDNPRRCVLIAGSIGCNARCDFCSSWMLSPTVLHRSPQNIVDEMIWLQERFGPGLVYHIVNPLFNADRSWVMALCKEMERRGPFPTVCMPDFALDHEMVRAMKRAGVFMVMMGLEFASTEVRTTRGKRPADPVAAYNLCAREGIITRAFLMLGRLGMTHNQLDDEIEQLNNLPFRADQLRINFEVPFPGTLVAHRVSDDDIVTDQSRWTTEEPVYRTELNQEEWQKVRKKITYAYHFSDRQMVHYGRQIDRFPELEPIYRDFLQRLKSASDPRPEARTSRVKPDPMESYGERAYG